MLTVRHFMQRCTSKSDIPKEEEIYKETCSMCLDESKTVMVIIEWMHIFCLNWLTRWYQEKPSCPMCKRAITKNFVLFLKSTTDPEATDEELDWNYFPAELWEKVKFVNFGNKCTQSTKVGKRELKL